jgi:hypothetical protein
MISLAWGCRLAPSLAPSRPVISAQHSVATLPVSSSSKHLSHHKHLHEELMVATGSVHLHLLTMGARREELDPSVNRWGWHFSASLL